MQQRQGTADQWLTADPVLGAGEIGFETDTSSFKIGDGVNSWTSLDYFTNESGLAASLEDYILATEKAAANGVATLDANGFVPAEQLDIDLAGYATETYADQAEADAITTANAYTDTEIAAIPAVDLTGYATESYVGTAVAGIVDTAPETLDTLNELAAALGDDPNFATTIATQIGGKADASHTHAISEVTNLQTTLDAKAATSHTHAISDVTNLQTSLDTKAPLVQAVTSTASDITIDNTYLNKLVLQTNTSYNTGFTLNSGISVGGRIDFINTGTATLYFFAGAGVNLLSADGFFKLTQYRAASLIVTAADTYVLVGGLS